jgi:hypothetical protein
VIPWLQAFSAPWVDANFPYGPEQAAAQIRAVYDVGLDDWIFWHPGSKYEQVAGAFEAELAPGARTFEPSPTILSQLEVVERSGSAAAREQVVAARRAGTR